MKINQITIDELKDILEDLNYNPEISTYVDGIYRIDLGNNHIIYGNDEFLDSLHKEMLTRVHSLKFSKAYNEYYGE